MHRSWCLFVFDWCGSSISKLLFNSNHTISSSNKYSFPLCFAFVDDEKTFDLIEFTPLFTALENQGVDTAYITQWQDQVMRRSKTGRQHFLSRILGKTKVMFNSQNIFFLFLYFLGWAENFSAFLHASIKMQISKNSLQLRNIQNYNIDIQKYTCMQTITFS